MQTEMKKTFLEKGVTKLKKFKSDCQAGNKEACTEYNSAKEGMRSACKKPDNQELCKALEGI